MLQAVRRHIPEDRNFNFHHAFTVRNASHQPPSCLQLISFLKRTISSQVKHNGTQLMMDVHHVVAWGVTPYIM